MIANLMGGDGLIVLVIALVVLVGGSQLPKIARNVGTAGKEFRKAQQEAEEDAERDRQTKAAKDAAMTPVAIPPAPGPAPAVGPPGPSTAAAPAAPADPAITLTPAQLDALLKAREDQVRGESN
jgi:sec-independent protein translocase protein TatA